MREGRFQQVLAAATAVSACSTARRRSTRITRPTLRYPQPMDSVALSPVIAVAGVGAVASRRIARTLLPLASLAAIASWPGWASSSMGVAFCAAPAG